MANIQTGFDNNRFAAFFTATTVPAYNANDKTVNALVKGQIALLDADNKVIDLANSNLAQPKYNKIAVAVNGRISGHIERNKVIEYMVQKYKAPTQQVSYLGYLPSADNGDLYVQDCKECWSLRYKEVPYIAEDSFPYFAEHCPCPDETKLQRVTALVSILTSYASLNLDYLAEVNVVGKVANTVAVAGTAKLTQNSTTVQLSTALTAVLPDYLVVNGNDLYKIKGGNTVGSQHLELEYPYANTDQVAATVLAVAEADVTNLGIKFVGRPVYATGGLLTPKCDNRSLVAEFNATCSCSPKKSEWRHLSLASNGTNTCCAAKGEDFFQLGMMHTPGLATQYPYNLQSTGELDEVLGNCNTTCNGFDIVKFRFSTEERDYLHNPRWMEEITLWGHLKGTPLTASQPYKDLIAKLDEWVSAIHAPVTPLLT